MSCSTKTAIQVFWTKSITGIKVSLDLKKPDPKNMTAKEELLSLLATRALEFRQVKLASGKISDYYLDCKRVSLHPRGLHLMATLLFQKICTGPFPAAVGGPTLGADPLVAAVILASHHENRPLNGFIIRKEPKKHGKEVWVEGLDNIDPNAEVAILEDVVTSGGSSIQAIERAEMAGLKVTRVLCIVDRQEGGSENLQEKGYTLEALFCARDLKNFHQKDKVE